MQPNWDDYNAVYATLKEYGQVNLTEIRIFNATSYDRARSKDDTLGLVVYEIAQDAGVGNPQNIEGRLLHQLHSALHILAMCLIHSLQSLYRKSESLSCI